MNCLSLLICSVCLSFSGTDNQSSDSTSYEQLQEVVVNGVRTQKNAPFAVTNIRKEELQEFSKTSRELPFLFQQTPGVVAWSENGLGTGTTYMRIRGAGDSRINVTLDGVPLNSPEDQCVFWANMNSYASLLGSVQIQRGVGTSTNGDGAFGGAIALASKTPDTNPSLELTSSFGSYNTFLLGGQFSSGLFARHWIFDGAYHETNTDGYIHGTSGRSGSYYGGLSYIADNVVLRYKNFGNFEKTGQAWNGVKAGDDDLSLMNGTYGANTGIKTYKDLYKLGLGRYNSLYETLAYDDNGHFARDADGNYITERYKMSDDSYWNKTTDNFWQSHNILSAAWNINNQWSTTASLHYTYGYGYYKEFRPNNKLSKFGMVATDGNGNSIKRTDFVRKKGLSQNTYGLVWNANYKEDSWDILGGLSLQNFDGNHFGDVTYIANNYVRERYLTDGNYRYYDSDAHKFDGNVFLKATYHIDDQWDVFADMQYRHVNYKTDGINDKFYDDASGYYNQRLDINESYRFLNPKAGMSWHVDGHRVYASLAHSHREPERNNFTDNGSYPFPKAEQLTDYELGYTYRNDIWNIGANFYYMDYTDQFVQTGALSDIGEALTINIKDSYRMGVEAQVACNITAWMTVEANAALSKNKIKDFDEVVEDWDNGSRTIHYDNSTIAYSPSFIGNGFIRFHYENVEATWHTNGVSRQYLDNTANKDRSLPSYTTSNFSASYTLDFKHKPWSIHQVVIGMRLNNVFNARYAAGGWVYSAIAESYGHTADNRYYQIGFIPMSGFTAMGNITVKF